MELAAQSYGKGRVRIMRVDRRTPRHCVRELSLSVMLQGDFAAAYTQADNGGLIATDTIKNIVNIVGREQVASDTEVFCQEIAERFLTRYPQVSRVEIISRETSWARMEFSGQPHPHSFLQNGNGMPRVTLVANRSSTVLRSGITGFTFLKSTGSGWSGYIQDDYTTLPETGDRIAATSMDADWGWLRLPHDTEAVRTAIIAQLLYVFANSFSASLQDSLFRMGQAALESVADITDIALSCPNKHYLPIDLSPFGMHSDNAVFTPTDEPHGQIECIVRR